MSKVFNMVGGGGGGPYASIFVTGLSETDTVTAVHKKTVQVPNPAIVTLPDGYTQLEYIESTGTQYVKTGISGITANFSAEIDFQFTSYANDKYIFGYFGTDKGQEQWRAGYYRDSLYTGGGFTYSESDPLKRMKATSAKAGTYQTGTTCSLFGQYAYNANNPGYGLCNAKLFSCIIRNNGVPIRDFIPAKRNSDSAIGLYDIISNIFYTNAGTGTFVAGSVIPAYIEMTVDDKTLTGKWTQKPNPTIHGLPNGYTELEYIEGTGTQYIDTGIKPNINTKIAMSFSGLSGKHLFDSGGSGINRSAFCGWHQSTDNDYTTFWATDSYPNTGSTTYKFGTGDYDIEFSAGLLVVNGESISFEKRTFSMNTSLKLYRCDNSNGRYKLKSFRHYNEDVLVNEYIPCKRLSDGAIGMYDLISNIFYGNSGTGEFVAGPEIPQTVDGFLIKPIRDLGTWTVTATDGTDTYTQDVLVDVITVYEIEITKKLYLYRDGDECEDVTGGWTASGYSFKNSSGITRTVVPATKNDDNMFVNGTGDNKAGIVGTASPIDLSKYSTLYIDALSHGESSTDQCMQCMINNSKNIQSGSVILNKSLNSELGAYNTKYVYSIDVSSIDKTAYLAFVAENSSERYGYVYKVWLE